MSVQYKTHTFKADDRWETIDTYWSSPLSYWIQKSMRVEPPLPLRITVLGRVIDEASDGWINYGGLSAVLVQSIQARGQAGQRIRAVISDEAVSVDEV